MQKTAEAGYNKVYAPVLICTYTRLDHLKRTIEALSNNACAALTDLFVASDYPYEESHRLLVENVRAYLRTINGFKSVNIILRDRNFGVSANYYDAIERIFDNYDRVILMEDDIVTGRHFLDFINDGLRLHGPNSKVFAVNGYMWPMLQLEPVDDVIYLPLYNAWGTGFHKDNFRKIKSNSQVSLRVISNWRLFLKANLIMPGIAILLYDMAKGKLQAWDVDCFLYMMERDLLVLFPKTSLVKNIGFDGSGINCDVDKSFAQQLINNDFMVNVRAFYPEEIAPSQKLIFLAFGGWRAFLKGLILFAIKRSVSEDRFRKLVYFKGFISSVFGRR